MLYKKECKYCPKKFECTTKKQLEFLYLQHLISKHSDKIEIKEKK